MKSLIHSLVSLQLYFICILFMFFMCDSSFCSLKMGSVLGKGYAPIGGLAIRRSESEPDNDQERITENDDIRKQRPSRSDSSGESVNCPTCQGTGRIPRGNKSTHRYTNSWLGLQ